MKGRYRVMYRDTMADARQGTVTPVSPLRLAKMSAVARGVRVMAVSRPVRGSQIRLFCLCPVCRPGNL